MNKSLVTIKEVFDYLKMDVPSEDDKDYVLVQSLIQRASSYVETYTKGPIISKTISAALDGKGDDEMEVSCYPVTGLKSVEVDGIDITQATGFYEDGLIYTEGVLFTKGRQNVKVSYECGYGNDAQSIPEDIKQAAVLIVYFWYKRDSLDYSETFGESEVIQGQWRFPSDAVRMLKPYKRHRLAVV